MKQITPRPAGSHAEMLLAMGLRAVRGLLVLTSWTLFLVALVAGELAERAGRSAARIRVR